MTDRLFLDKNFSTTQLLTKEKSAIENYPEDKYGPSCLISGKTNAGRPLHIHVSMPLNVKIITVYEPDPEKWIDNRTRRR